MAGVIGSVFDEGMAAPVVIRSLCAVPERPLLAECRALQTRLHDTRSWFSIWPALDVIAQRRVLEVLHQVCAAKNAPALLFITHDIAVAAQLCDRAIVMERGRVVESATLRQLITQPKHPYTRQLIAAAQTPKSGTEAIAV